jgi:hypothetical protein
VTVLVILKIVDEFSMSTNSIESLVARLRSLPWWEYTILGANLRLHPARTCLEIDIHT